MNFADWPAAPVAVSALVPTHEGVANQAVRRCSFDLEEAILAATGPLGPAGALGETQFRVPAESSEGGMPNIQGYAGCLVVFGACDHALASILPPRRSQ